MGSKGFMGGLGWDQRLFLGPNPFGESIHPSVLPPPPTNTYLLNSLQWQTLINPALRVVCGMRVGRVWLVCMVEVVRSWSQGVEHKKCNPRDRARGWAFSAPRAVQVWQPMYRSAMDQSNQDQLSLSIHRSTSILDCVLPFLDYLCAWNFGTVMGLY